MNYKYILLEIKNKIGVLKFNRPEQLNAMNSKMMEEIIDALRIIDEAEPQDIKIAIITGMGKAFMAGADIKEYALQSPSQFNQFQKNGRKIYSSIESNSKPIIGAINGYAFGGGLEIALACDLIVAVNGAKMGLPEILLNLIPGGGGTVRLAKKIGINRANEMVMTGRTITSEEMYDFGAINKLFPLQNFNEDVLKYATEFIDKPSDNLKVIKYLTQFSIGTLTPEIELLEHNALVKFYNSEDAQKKLKEFYNKSKEPKK